MAPVHVIGPSPSHSVSDRPIVMPSGTSRTRVMTANAGMT